MSFESFNLGTPIRALALPYPAISKDLESDRASSIALNEKRRIFLLMNKIYSFSFQTNFFKISSLFSIIISRKLNFCNKSVTLTLDINDLKD